MAKLEFSQVKAAFELAGCELLTETYVNNHTPLPYRCSCGSESIIAYANFRRGSRCYNCGFSKSTSKKRKDIDWAKQQFTDRGCELFEKFYENNYTPMSYRCSCGNTSKIRMFCLIKGQRCEMCDGCRGETHYNWNPDREIILLNRTLQRRSRQLLAYSLKKTNQSKTAKKEYMLGYSPRQLAEHIRSFPDWNDMKNLDWHIDHIFPVKAFVDHGVTDIKLINCLENLRPIRARDNLVKNDKYDKEEFLSWLGTKTSNIILKN